MTVTVTRSSVVLELNGGLPQSSATAPTVGPEPYEHQQLAPLMTWTINHNLGRTRPSVTLFTIGGVEMSGEYVSPTPNITIVMFVTPTTGYARII